MSKFLPTVGFKWIDPKDFDSSKYSSNSSTGYVLEVDLEYPKVLHELHNNYLLAPNKIKIKRERYFKYQLMISNFFNSPIGDVKKLVSHFFNKEKYVLHYENMPLYFRLRLKLKNISYNRI